MTTISNRAVPQRLIAPMLILVLLALAPSAGRALPPPLNPAELVAKSDLVIEGRVAKVWLYSQWLTHLKEGGMAPAEEALLQQAPASDQAMLSLIRNFPYKSWPGLPVAVDGINLAEVQVEKTLKGQAKKIIFIPFIRFHFLTARRLEGPWTERQYRTGEHLKMHLRQNGPFFESTWWNSVRPLDK